LHRHSHLLQHRDHHALAVLPQRRHPMQRQHLRIAILSGMSTGRLHRLLRLHRQPIPLDRHNYAPLTNFGFSELIRRAGASTGFSNLTISHSYLTKSLLLASPCSLSVTPRPLFRLFLRRPTVLFKNPSTSSALQPSNPGDPLPPRPSQNDTSLT